MPFKTFTNGSILPDTDLNDYLMEQVIISCTSGTRPAAPNDGMMVYETDTKRNSKYNAALAAWETYALSRTAFTPTLTSSGTAVNMGTSPTRNGWYTIGPGPMCTYGFHFVFGTSMAAGTGTYFMSLPIASINVSATGNQATGSLLIADASAATFKIGTILIPSTNLSVVQGILESSTQLNSTTYAWATSDYISGTITYPI
jgi:hypothetical protein